MDKFCGGCEQSRPTSAFGVSRSSEDGLNSRCRECVNAQARDARAKKASKKPAGWKKKTADMRAYRVAWNAAHPGYATRKHAEWLSRNRWRQRVKDATRRAVKAGRIAKWPCEVCGSEHVDAHHPDYSAPLAVVWLCREHHREVHAMVAR